jgi:hypothetical protein
MANSSPHVVPSPKGGWSVRKSGADRASKTFATQADAINYGKSLAKKEKSDLYIHGRSGRVRDHTSYKE